MSIASAKAAIERDEARIAHLNKVVENCRDAFLVLDGKHDYCVPDSRIMISVSANDKDPDEYPHTFPVDIPASVISEDMKERIKGLISATQAAALAELNKIEDKYKEEVRVMFCEMQSIDKETGKIMCLANLADGRVFDCPYESELTREEVPYPCSDYRPKKKN